VRTYSQKNVPDECKRGKSVLAEKIVLLLSVPPAVWWATDWFLRRRCGCAAPRRTAILAAAAALLASLAMLIAPSAEQAPSGRNVLLSIWGIPLTSWGHSIAGSAADVGPLPLWPILASALLVVAGAVDATCRVIPDQVTLPGLIAGLLLASLDGELGQVLLGGLAGFVFFLVLYLIRPGALGFGDVKLAAFIGVATGLKCAPVALFAGTMAGGLYGVVLLLARRATLREAVPYGPALAFGGIVGLWLVGAGW
jgi:prepilin signal peptidase PulO-like enzyme (type II secretory pathway)